VRSAAGQVLAALLMGALANTCFAQDSQPSSSAWQLLKEKYYGDRNMGVVDEQFMSLEAPSNTPDAAATPVALHFANDPNRAIKQVRVFIDNNPSPLVATFDFEAGAVPITGIDMRVRVDRFTSVRAIAETASGDLEMRSTWVKAAGGCSAPPAAAGSGALGEIRFRPSMDAKSLQVSIRHPNSSGFQIDPRTNAPIPAHYISSLTLQAGGKPVLSAQLGISISENPTLRLASERPLPAPVTIDAVDSETHAHYSATLADNRVAAAQ
jgi:sulfur-oxidizing protein SoxY